MIPLARNWKRTVAVLGILFGISMIPSLCASAEDVQEPDAAAERSEATDPAQSGWFEEDGRFCYLLEDGTKAVGEVEIDGVPYLFALSGALKTDWQTVQGRRYYYDPETGQAVFGWVEYFGASYYVTPESGKLTGEAEIDGMTCMFDAEGVLCSGEVLPDTFFAPPVQENTENTEVLEETTPVTEETALVTEETAHVTEEIPTEAPVPEEELPIVQEDGSVWLDVPDYKQKDPAWGSEKLGSSTIGKVGCLVTSMAMLHTYTTGEECTPVDMKAKLTFTSGGGLASWDHITDLGYTAETCSTSVTAEIMARIYELLCTGRPVVLGSKGSGQHYVCITGYTGDGKTFRTSDFLINDPGYSRRFTLADHLAQYRTLYKLIYLP